MGYNKKYPFGLFPIPVTELLKLLGFPLGAAGMSFFVQKKPLATTLEFMLSGSG